MAVAAYAYEVKNDPVMSDAEFDALCREIDPDMPTGNRKLDKFFMLHFEPDTGVWVHQHPEIEKLDHIYRTVHRAAPAEPDWRDRQTDGQMDRQTDRFSPWCVCHQSESLFLQFSFFLLVV